jgi:signal transduction histidine kinase
VPVEVYARAVRARRIPFTGEGSKVAANQAAALFALSGTLALLSLGIYPNRWVELVIIAGGDLVVCGLTLVVPWDRLHRYAPLVLAVPALAILGFSTWTFGGVATGTGPFFVLMFAWLGLHFPSWSVFAMAPPALVAYTVPLVVTEQSPQVVSSGVVLIPIAVGIGLLIGRQVAYQRSAREDVRRVERWRAALTATLAHDVRSPLTSIHGALRQLRASGADLPAASREAIISAALRQTARVRRLATGLLDIDRVEHSGSLKLDLRDIRLREAVEESVSYLNTKADGGLRVEIPADLIARVDRQRLEQMVINLTANALHHGASPVVISGYRSGDVLTIEVRDHGPGVPEHLHPELFARFGGADPDPESVGLGLWVVRQLVRAHGGEVRYENADPGARFLLTLPGQPGEPARNGEHQQLIATAGAHQ